MRLGVLIALTSQMGSFSLRFKPFLNKINLSGRSACSSSIRLFSTAPNTVALPTVPYSSINALDGIIAFGDYSLIASQDSNGSGRKYAQISSLDASSKEVGTKVWLRGRLSAVRAKGNACFLVLRGSSFYTLQCCHFKVRQ
jgi:hypothetical protein